MRSSRINREGELRGQAANLYVPGKMAGVCVFLMLHVWTWTIVVVQVLLKCIYLQCLHAVFVCPTIAACLVTTEAFSHFY